jgi:hypothetical protein
MGIRLCVAGFCAAAIALAAVAAAPADAVAQPQKKRAVAKQKVVAKGAPRARITVQRRSFLDAGTEILPGEGGYTNYAIPPGYSPTAVIENRAGMHRSPLPGPYDLPDRRNPYPWHWCVGC